KRRHDQDEDKEVVDRERPLGHVPGDILHRAVLSPTPIHDQAEKQRRYDVNNRPNGRRPDSGHMWVPQRGADLSREDAPTIKNVRIQTINETCIDQTSNNPREPIRSTACPSPAWKHANTNYNDRPGAGRHAERSSCFIWFRRYARVPVSTGSSLDASSCPFVCWSENHAATAMEPAMTIRESHVGTSGITV